MESNKDGFSAIVEEELIAGLPPESSATVKYIVGLATPLGKLALANACVQKKSKTSGIELSPHKRFVIKGLHKTGCSVKSISEIENMPRSMVRDTIKFLNARPKGHSLSHSGRPPTLTRAEKRSIIRFCRENVKVTYLEVKQELQLSCSLSTIRRIVRKLRIKK
jgi:transposase